ncbi:Gfo/Idh/MocA family protein [Pseudonocardia sp. CA-107938]|uniref:Gfo/Idh/MocA family protein n=1 Tax=Pseudonocardia sp. CA-107938 TaxID=3240021 RepID=UPI003D8A8BBD
MPLRIGVLGAARIAPTALIRPARVVPDVEVVAVAARDRDRAAAFAAKHGIPTVHGSYADLVADDSLDAIYNPLPNGLHGHWTIAAVQAGRHVLCEKPFTANADEARAVAEVARPSGKVVMEAFHYRYHPMTARVLEIVASGELGEVGHIETWMCIPLLLPRDIRWNLRLAGGTLMDVGCYALHQLRTIAGAEPEVVSATARTARPGVDRFVQARMRFADGRTGGITASMASRRLLSLGARVEGTEGTLDVRNLTGPQFAHRLRVRRGTEKRVEHVTKEPTYNFQLRAFAGAVLRSEPFPTDLDDAVANMAAIDACYRAAGLEPRQPTPV